MTEPENHTLVLLREMRAEQHAFRQEVLDRFDRIEKRIDSMHANGVKALAQFFGHRAMVERSIASLDKDVSDVKARVEVLETAR